MSVTKSGYFSTDLLIFRSSIVHNDFCLFYTHCLNNLKDHTSGLSESNFDHTHLKKAIFIKQFTWQLMCKNLKNTLKINFLYLTRTSDRLHMFFTHIFRASPQHLAVIRSSLQHHAASPRTSFVGALVCRRELWIKPSVAERRRKQ